MPWNGQAVVVRAPAQVQPDFCQLPKIEIRIPQRERHTRIEIYLAEKTQLDVPSLVSAGLSAPTSSTCHCSKAVKSSHVTAKLLGSETIHDLAERIRWTLRVNAELSLECRLQPMSPLP